MSYDPVYIVEGVPVNEPQPAEFVYVYDEPVYDPVYIVEATPVVEAKPVDIFYIADPTPVVEPVYIVDATPVYETKPVVEYHHYYTETYYEDDIGSAVLGSIALLGLWAYCVGSIMWVH